MNSLTVQRTIAEPVGPNVGRATTRLDTHQNGNVNWSRHHFSDTASRMDHGHSVPSRPNLMAPESFSTRDSILPPPPYEAVAVTRPPIVVIQNV